MVCTKHLLVLCIVSIYLPPSKPSYCQTDSLQWQDSPSLLQMLLQELPRAGGGLWVGPRTGPESAKTHGWVLFRGYRAPFGHFGETPTSFSSYI